MASTAESKPLTPANPISTPSNFPVTWEHPDDPRLFWTFDPLHFPAPITPMSDVFIRSMEQDGFKVAFEAYDIPIRVRSRRINTYHYQASVPVAVPPEERQAQAARAQEKVVAAMASLAKRWADEWLPEITRHLAAWEAFELAGTTLPALLVHLDETIARHIRVSQIHGLVDYPATAAMSAFDDLYQTLFGDASAVSAYRLLQGFDNKTLETGRALWHLSRQALALPEVRAILATRGPTEVLPALEQASTAQSFRAALQAYLDEYGKRSNNQFELADPGWIEDPTPLIRTLQDYIAQPDRDPEAEQAVLAADRERLIAEARARLIGQPPEVTGQFEFLLQTAQVGTVLKEDHNFWIDSRAMYQVRRVLLEFGRRLAAAGVLEWPDDVFYLTVDELRETILAQPKRDQRRLIAGRRAEMEYFRTIIPPAALGTPLPITSGEDPMARLWGKFFGAPPQGPAQPDIVRGSAGAAGTARGRARVIRTLAEAGKLHKGDVLVTPATTPPWTPLFATVAAVVTDIGGVLSHGAVVAREYGIPAVVGTGSATAAIHDGQLLEVDGSAGIVRILDGAERPGRA